MECLKYAFNILVVPDGIYPDLGVCVCVGGIFPEYSLYIRVRGYPLNGIFGPCACLLAGGCGVWWLLARRRSHRRRRRRRHSQDLFRLTFWPRFYHPRKYLRNQV